MKTANSLISLLILFSLITSCKENAGPEKFDAELWKLSWRMVANTMEDNYELAEIQFDSIQQLTDHIDQKTLITGLESKFKLKKSDDVISLLNKQSKEMLIEICPEQFLSNFKPCLKYSSEKVENEELKMELIRMFIDDQASRGNIMENVISKYNIKKEEITIKGPVAVDEQNRNRLKEIINKYGFPTRKLVGKDAMDGIFYIIQHSDMDKEWQKSQLQNVKKAVKNGDMDGQDYAYLYDRIKVNSGEKQLYGTQFAKVDPVNRTVELAETEDIENLNKRRMEIGLMPIEMYKDFMLKYL